MTSNSALERPWKVKFLLCGRKFSPCRTAQPHRGSSQLLKWQWPFTSSDWHFTETLTQQFLVYSTSAAQRVGEKYSCIRYCIHLFCAHHPPPNKRNKCTSYRDLFLSGFGKTRAWLLLLAQPGWLRLRMSLTSSSLLYLIILPALLILPAAWRAMEIPRSLSQMSFPALPGLPDAQVVLHSSCSWQQRGGGTGTAQGRRWRAACTSPGCRRDTSGTQAHWRLREFCPCFS